jgi:hypothetical protein
MVKRSNSPVSERSVKKIMYTPSNPLLINKFFAMASPAGKDTSVASASTMAPHVSDNAYVTPQPTSPWTAPTVASTEYITHDDLEVAILAPVTPNVEAAGSSVEVRGPQPAAASPTAPGENLAVLIDQVAKPNTSVVANLVQKPLTEANLRDYEKELKNLENRVSSSLKQIEPTDSMTAVEKGKLHKMEEMIQQKNLHPRSSMGVEFRKAIAGTADAEVYAKLDRKASHQFRLDWLKGQHEHYKKERTRGQSWSRVDYTKGSYQSLGKMVVQDGGWTDKDAVAAALKVAEKCSLMGPPWVFEHPQSERTHYLVLDFGFSEHFTDCWKTFEKEWSMADCDNEPTDTSDTKSKGLAVTDGSAAARPQGGGVPSAGGLKGDGKGAAACKAKASGTAKTGSKPELSPVEKAEKDRHAKTWGTASKLKTEFLHTVQGATEIAQLILDQREWAFANNEQHRGKLVDAMQALKGQLTLFHKRLVTEDKAAITKDCTIVQQMTELTSFIALRPNIEFLGKLVKKLVKKKHVENED